MLLKIAGMGITLVAGILAGNGMAGNLAGRAKALGQLQGALALLETEIGFAQSSLPEACVAIASGCAGGTPRLLFTTVGRLVGEDGWAASAAWNKALAEAAKVSPLTESDWEPLRRLGPVLGVTGRGEQLRHLALARSSLAIAEEEAAERSVRLGRPYRYLGFAAAVVAILLVL